MHESELISGYAGCSFRIDADEDEHEMRFYLSDTIGVACNAQLRVLPSDDEYANPEHYHQDDEYGTMVELV